MKALNEAYRVLGDPERRAAYDLIRGGSLFWDEPGLDRDMSGQGLREYEPELDSELSIGEVLARRRAAQALAVRKIGYRQYEVFSVDQSVCFPVSADSGCCCPDARGVAGPFGCKHWYAMEAFRNNGDRPVDTRRSA